MVARYGDRTRVSQQVSSWGKDVEGGAGGVAPLNVETFTAPGTWTWPGNVDFATVTIVGGGGGSGGVVNFGPNITSSGSGGGGGVRVETVPVTGPEPVVVGAGGTGGAASPSAPLRQAGLGGTTSFGSFSVDGGAGGRESGPVPTARNGLNAPADGGGGGEGNGNPSLLQGSGGLYGYPASPHRFGGGGAGSTGEDKGFNPSVQGRITGGSFLGFGAGGSSASYGPGPSPFNTFALQLQDHRDATPYFGDRPNTGNGAPRPFFPDPAGTTVAGRNGSAGIVIVRWWE